MNNLIKFISQCFFENETLISQIRTPNIRFILYNHDTGESTDITHDIQEALLKDINALCDNI